ncbi:MAG: hypothetical protein ACFFDK_08760 [Promethearchaeota archaeon]
MRLSITKTKLKIVYIISAIATIFLTFVWFSGIFTEEQWYEAYIFQDVVTIASAFLGFLFLLYVAVLYNLSTKAGKIWLLFALGLLAWTIGEVIYSYYELFTDIQPFPSIADFFYLIAFIPIYIGLIMQFRLIKIPLSNQEKFIIVLLFTVISITVTITVIIFPLQEVYPIPEEELFAYIVSGLYPICDLILILCVLIVFFKLRRGKINVAWVLLLIAFLLDTIGNILFNWVVTVRKEEMLFEPFDLFFIFGYIFVINSAITMIYLMSKTFENN